MKKESLHHKNSSNKRPLISFITRHCKRPELFKRCVDSIQKQTSQDFDQYIINDDVGKGLLWANTQIAQYADRLLGKYIYILDDDDYLICDDFTSEFKILLENFEIKPDVVFCKGYILDRIHPARWKQYPQRGDVGAPNFIIKNSIFQKFSEIWKQPRAADYFFISKILESQPKIFWWDKVVFYADPTSNLIKSGIDPNTWKLKSWAHVSSY